MNNRLSVGLRKWWRAVSVITQLKVKAIHLVIENVPQQPMQQGAFPQEAFTRLPKEVTQLLGPLRAPGS